MSIEDAVEQALSLARGMRMCGWPEDESLAITTICKAWVAAEHHRSELAARVERLLEQIPERYACQECGRRDGLDAVVPDSVWEQIRGGLNLLCLWCIDRRCEAAGITTSASLHFAGKAITGTSQSAADQEHISRLATQLDAALAASQGVAAAPSGGECSGLCKPPSYDAACPMHGAAALKEALSNAPND